MPATQLLPLLLSFLAAALLAPAGLRSLAGGRLEQENYRGVYSGEFLDGEAGRSHGWVRHRMKRVEAMSGRYFWTESLFEVAAPGVDILVPAPEGGYQITTGTSVAAAEVSGIVALLLERNPKLTPADIRRILTLSAKRLSPGDRDDNFGSGLIDPLQALQLADPRTATTTPPHLLRQR